MLIVDDILLAPFRGLLAVFRKVHEAVEAELEQRKRNVTSELGELYMQLETGKISEEEYQAREKELLDQLEQVQEQLGEGTDQREPSK